MPCRGDDGCAAPLAKSSAGRPNVRRLCEEGPQPVPVNGIVRGNRNAFVAFDERLLLKLFRRIGSGINPDLEVRRFLTERKKFTHIPIAAGALEYSDASGNRATLGVLETFVPLEATAWNYFRDMLSRFFENALAQPAAHHEAPQSVEASSVLDLATTAWPAQFEALAHEFRLPSNYSAGTPPNCMRHWLGCTRSELCSPALHSLRSALSLSIAAANDRQGLTALERKDRRVARNGPGRGPRIARPRVGTLRQPAGTVGPENPGLAMRIHGDFHLQHVLYTGKDFLIVDFEGEPGKTASERRLKRLPLVDVACMIRSFHYAVAGASAQHLEAVATSAENVAVLEQAGRDWFQGTTAAFLKSYLAAAAGQAFLPASHETLQILLHILLLRRSMMELNFELTNRLDWVAGAATRRAEAAYNVALRRARCLKVRHAAGRWHHSNMIRPEINNRR